MLGEILGQIQSLTPGLVLALGFVIGLQHAFEPDHIAAVSTLVSKRNNRSQSIKQQIKEDTLKSSIIGVFWGAGHTTSLVFMGLLVYVLAVNIPEIIFSGLEIVVGMMLIFLAFTTFTSRKIFKIKHMHPHTHEDGIVHIHPHTHDGVHKHTHKSYIIGCIHGLAGSGALVVVTAAALTSVQEILSFILIFGFGSIIGMALVSSLIGIPFAFSKRISSFNQTLRFVAAAVSFLIGITIIYQVTFVEKLFNF